ncbi:MAG: hypothetical protein NVS3B7_02610 [Candidatus Elarobacter sp.]
MIQSQWPGLARNLDTLPSPLAGSAARQAGGTAARLMGTNPDGLASPWWTCGTGAVGTAIGSAGPLCSAADDGSGATLSSLIASLIARLQRLVGGFVGESQAENGAQQRFASLDVSSTGDPHLAGSGTLSDSNAPFAQKFDSMVSHDDLVHSTAIDGGYRVSTAVTQPGPNGVTTNQSATVHANYGWDQVTLNRDGSYAISDDGDMVEVAKGRSLQLSGGETVARNDDGSLTVTAENADGGTIATTMRANGGGVDVTTHAQAIAAGGDVVAHGTLQADRPVRYGHGHHHHPAALVAPAPAAATAPPAGPMTPPAP